MSIPTNRPTWRFPPRNGGQDVVQDSASEFFTTEPIAKLVRETIQNSLDAKQSGLSSPVKVTFRSGLMESNVFDGTTLKAHLKACYERTEKEKMAPEIGQFYKRAEGFIKKRTPYLSIVDSGTTGLNTPRKWSALVEQAGAVSKPDKIPAGGAFGIGKNAVFNLSAIRTVLYSTCYFERRKGRREQVQGKSILMTHTPHGARRSQDVQHVGFLKWPKLQNLSELPSELRLDDFGTGVFILGFDPPTSSEQEWMDEIIKAVIDNFFFAVHTQALVVEIASSGSGSESITHETVATHISRLYGDKPSNGCFYHQAVSSNREPIHVEVEGDLGDLDLYLLVDEGPSRTAYVNRMGMLISESKEIAVNPVTPMRRALWPKFAAVVVPVTDSGDRWSRRMENPSHDAVAPTKLRDPKDRRNAIRTFENARRAVRQAIDDQVGTGNYDSESNIKELRSILPDEFEPDRPGNVQLISTEVRPPSNRMEEVVDLVEEDGLDEDFAPVSEDPFEDTFDPGPNAEQHPKPGSADTNPVPIRGPGLKPQPRVSLEKTRFIAAGESECVVAFELNKRVKQMEILLKPAGVEPGGNEAPISIVNASLNGFDLENSDGGGVLISEPPVDTRLAVKIMTGESISNRAVIVLASLLEA